MQVATRKKCPACRFDKCLKMGMKLEGKHLFHFSTGRFRKTVWEGKESFPILPAAFLLAVCITLREHLVKVSNRVIFSRVPQQFEKIAPGVAALHISARTVSPLSPHRPTRDFRQLRHRLRTPPPRTPDPLLHRITEIPCTSRSLSCKNPIGSLQSDQRFSRALSSNSGAECVYKFALS